MPPCILCKQLNFRAIHQKGPWTYRQCRECGLVSIHPRPGKDKVLENYQDYLPNNPEEIDAWETMVKPVNHKSAELIENHSRRAGTRTLDIGCGYGFFLAEMKTRGWNVEGIEISRTGRDYAVHKLGLPVYSQVLEELALKSNAYDVVTLHYVIEHVTEPVHLLKEVKRILAPGGLVLLRWPHTTPIVRTLGPFANRLDLYHTPYHLYDFSPRTIRLLLNLSGFTRAKTFIGGYTLPRQRTARRLSRLFGIIGETLHALSGGTLIFPGISKTTLAFKEGTFREPVASPEV